MANYTAPAFDTVLAQLKGRKGLRTVKPKDGFAAYVWRMARFHSGIDPTMPCVCEFDIANWADHSYKDGDREAFRALKAVGDQYADQACVAFGLDPMKTARRWRQALYG